MDKKNESNITLPCPSLPPTTADELNEWMLILIVAGVLLMFVDLLYVKTCYHFITRYEHSVGSYRLWKN